MYINPYLTFDGDCETAFAFYRQSLGGELKALIRYGDKPDVCGQIPASAQDRIMHACLVLGGQMLMGSDNASGQPYEGFKGCSIALAYDDVGEAERAFAALAEGGEVTMPMQEMFWAEKFGVVVDRFGLTWLINGGPRD